MLNWLFKNNMDRENDIVVKTLTSKGETKTPIIITVGDIKKGIAKDAYGYENEVVLFLRKNKKDR
tara:strand:- start:1509 stop:1703 length:195 start_codon:yes stop_codon:yes gene_type:complete